MSNVPVPRTRQQIAQKIKDQLGLIAERQEDDKLNQVSNGHEDGAFVIGPQGVPMLKRNGMNEIVYEDDQPVRMTYADLQRDHEAALQRVWDHANGVGVADLVRKMIEAEQQAVEE